MIARALRIVGRAVVWLFTLSFALWAFGALWFDAPWWNHVLAWVFAALVLAILLFVPGPRAKLIVIFAAPLLVLGWWTTLQPKLHREWQPDVAHLPRMDIQGDEVQVHNVRNCEYRTETDYTPRWETRTVRLSQLIGIDMAICYWGSPWMAHPIVSFQFADGPPLCVSIETRKEVGESYSASGGLYRRYELIYIVADERDVIRLRTNYRQGEDVYLYRLNLPVEQARARFLDYAKTINAMHARARWYNAITTNCTTAIRAQHPPGQRIPWDWRILVNGKGDEMLFERGKLHTGGRDFATLKQQAHVNPIAQQIADPADFSAAIRRAVFP